MEVTVKSAGAVAQLLQLAGKAMQTRRLMHQARSAVFSVNFLTRAWELHEDTPLAATNPHAPGVKHQKWRVLLGHGHGLNCSCTKVWLGCPLCPGCSALIQSFYFCG